MGQFYVPVFIEGVDLKQQLGPVEPLALAAAEELLFEPLNLRPQHRHLLLESGDLAQRLFESRHAVTTSR